MSFRLMWIELRSIPESGTVITCVVIYAVLDVHVHVVMPSLSSEESDNHVRSCPDEADESKTSN